VIDSGSGNDFLFGNQSENTLNGGTGNDYLAGDSGDILSGNDGVDVLVGREGSDNLNGGAGNDTLYAGDQYGSFDSTSDSFTATVGENMTLAGKNTNNNRFFEFWIFYDSVAKKTILFMDRDQDFVVRSRCRRHRLVFALGDYTKDFARPKPLVWNNVTVSLSY
jgi:RTX calcium-binding nonapeptide repeat (4 copies)